MPPSIVKIRTLPPNISDLLFAEEARRQRLPLGIHFW